MNGFIAIAIILAAIILLLLIVNHYNLRQAHENFKVGPVNIPIDLPSGGKITNPLKPPHVTNSPPINIDVNAIEQGIEDFGKQQLQNLGRVGSEISHFGQQQLQNLGRVGGEISQFGQQQLQNLGSVGGKIVQFGEQQLQNLSGINDEILRLAQRELKDMCNMPSSGVSKQFADDISKQLNFVKTILLIGMPSIGALTALGIIL